MGISEIFWNISGISRNYLTSNSGHARAPVSLRTQSLLCVPTLWSAEWSSTQSLYPHACCWDGRSTTLTFRSLLDFPKGFSKRCSGRASANPSQETHCCHKFAERGMVITPCPHVDKDGRLRLRVDLTGVKGGRGALWHDVLWVFSTTSRSLCLHERTKDFLLAWRAASAHNSLWGARQDCKRFLPWARAPSEISARDKMISLWLDSARM